MVVTPAEIPDVLLVEPAVYGDDRGFFYESYNQGAREEGNSGCAPPSCGVATPAPSGTSSAACIIPLRHHAGEAGPR